MAIRGLGLSVALTGLALYGCGDDDTEQMRDPASTTEAGSASDAAQKSDATTPSDGGAVADASTRDGGMDAALPSDGGGASSDANALDSRVPDSASRDAAPSPPDSASPSQGTDGGVVVPATGDPRSAACLACEMSQCNMTRWPNADGIVLKACSEFANETAAEGPAMGTLRRTLCENLLSCVRSTRCGDPMLTAQSGTPLFDALYCLSGPEFENDQLYTDVDDLSDLHGPCLTSIVPATETDDVNQILERWVDPTHPIGAVIGLVQCQQSLCADECYNPCANKPDGAACNDEQLAAPADAGARDGGPGVPGTCKMQRCVDDTSVVDPV